ncbi:2-hydroxy-adenosine triphosphate pyrophosphatase [Aureococcus anophagefferens]|nr:2-hydroxy-adenosine triphosphate pyrophosphatase [Aureococcus anophagefferens]
MDFLFSKPQFNCIGDPYKDPPMDPYKHGTSKGRRQFLTAPPKKGQTANAIGYGPLAYKPMYLPGKEPFVENHKLQARNRVAGKGKFLTPNGFTYASPMKKSASPGDMCGTFNKTPVEHLPDGTAMIGRRSKVDVDVIARRNIQTSPGKRGGFGVAGTLIGGNPEYVHSSYTACDDKIRADMRKHREIMGERRPFTSTTRTMDFFDSHDHCSASKIYSNGGDFPPPKDRPLRPKTSEEGEEMRVFRPSSPAKRAARELLLGFKKRGLGVNKYNGFGGKFEVGETPAECALRETREECGLSPRRLEWKAQLLFTFRDSGTVMRVHVFEASDFDEAALVETDEMRPEWFDVALPTIACGTTAALMPLLLDGVAFEAWFDYAAGGEDVNTVAEYVLNRTPASPRHVVAARNAASPP